MSKLRDYLAIAGVIGMIIFIVGLGVFGLNEAITYLFEVSGIERKDRNYKGFCEAKHLVLIRTRDGAYCVQGESI